MDEHSHMSASGQLVDPETDFQRESTKPGGVSRNQALLAASGTLKRSQPQIRERVTIAFAAMEALLYDPIRLDEDGAMGLLAEHVAQLRDYAALADFPIVSAIAAPFHALIVSMERGTSQRRPEALRVFGDAIRHTSDPVYRSRPLSDVSTLVQGLKDVEASLLPEHMRCLW